MKQRRRTVWLVAALALAGLVALGAVTARHGDEVALAEPGGITVRVLANAVVVPVEGVAEVRPRVEGRVLRVLVREGDRVEQGQLLAEIEADTQQAETERRVADLAAARAAARGVASGARREERAAAAAEAEGEEHALALERDRLARLEKLVGEGGATAAELYAAQQATRVSEARLEAARARMRLADAGGRPDDVKAAEAHVVAAEAALAAARTELGRARLVAPIAGTVLARRVDPGDTTSIGPGSIAVFEIADVAHNELRLEVEEPDVDVLAVGVELTVVRLGGAAVGQARVRRVAERMERRAIGAEDARVRSDGLVRAAWAEWQSPTELPIGLRLEAWIERPEREVALRLPREAVVVRDGGAWVEVPFLLWSRSRRVALGASDERWVEVSGLPAGTAVVVPR
ncbi:MAG: biotin/lipoyl-binding protein [Polyangiaceae bacterium]|nr:biotin/lipoyl-binding protein [Polyangiaceae bacterium]